jgi:hypothetical protein
MQNMWFKLALVIGSVITIHASAINIHAKANGNKTLDDNVDLADLLNRVESLEEKMKTISKLYIYIIFYFIIFH